MPHRRASARKTARLVAGRGPGVLVHPAKERPCFRVVRVDLQYLAVVLACPIERMTGTPQDPGAGADPFSEGRADFSARSPGPVQVLKREPEALGFAQGLARLDPRFARNAATGASLASTRTSPMRSARRADPAASPTGSCCSQNSRTSPMHSDFPIRLLEVRHEVVDRADLAIAPGFHRRPNHLGQVRPVRFDGSRVGARVLDLVAEFPVRYTDRRLSSPSPAHEYDASRAKRVTNTESYQTFGLSF